MNLDKDVSSWASVKPEAVMTMSRTAIQNVLAMALHDIQQLGREVDRLSAPAKSRRKKASKSYSDYCD